MDWDPRYNFLSDEEVEELCEDNPQLRNEDYCPTCFGKKRYIKRIETYPIKVGPMEGPRTDTYEELCNCAYQLALHKHYLAAGIGVTYQRLDWEDLTTEGLSPAMRTFVARYIDESDKFVSRGVGMILHGGFGSGKTMTANLILKALVKKGFRCYGTTFANMLDMFTAGWRDVAEQKKFHSKIKRSQVLLLDDVGKEMRTRASLSEATFDTVLRTRVQTGLPTLITTNMTPEELGVGYGGAILSLLRESSIQLPFTGEDHRGEASERLRSEIMSGRIRPIF